MAGIYHHHREDWCHLCGRRSADNADVWYRDPSAHPNAENASATQNAANFGDPGNTYVRICKFCAGRIAAIAGDPNAQPVEVPKRRPRKARRVLDQ